MIIRKLWPSLVWALLILILTGVPGNYIPEVATFRDWLTYDKLVHIFIFGTLSFLLFFNFREQYFASKKRYRLVIAIVFLTLAYGLLTEVLQDTVFVGRDGNMFDFIADGLGAFTGWLVFSFIFRKKIR